jgi:hypothetical protein
MGITMPHVGLATAVLSSDELRELLLFKESQYSRAR